MTLSPLTRSGPALQVNGVKWTASGLNCYWLGLNDNAGGVTFPSQATISAALTGMKGMGVNLVRAHTIGISAGTSQSYLTGYSGTSPQYVEGNLDAADWAVYQAGVQGIRLMVPLTDNWNYYHSGLWWFVHQAYLQNPSGLTDVNGTVKDDPNNRQFFANTAAGLRIRALFKAYIVKWLNHVNPYTGVAYKDDPTIAIVETGNEIYYAAQLGTDEWTQDIASTIKSVAPSKLVADGSAASGQAVSTMPGLTAAAVDVVGGHYYPQDPANGYAPTTFSATASSFPAGSARQQLAADSAAAVAANRAFILGEYPWTRSDVAAWWSDIEESTAIDGDMAWSFIAGTETHGGSFGSDDYPVHFPYVAGQEAAAAPALTAHIRRRAGTGMPVGDLPGGWKQVSAVDFSTIPDFPVGTLASNDGQNSRLTTTDAASLALRDKVRFYQAGHPDTSQVGVYDPARFSNVSGILTLNMAVIGGVPTGGHLHPVIAGQESTSGAWRMPTAGVRYQVCARFNADDPHWGGVTFAISNAQAEDDWSEGSSQSPNIQGFFHKAVSGQSAIGTVAGASRHDWHVYEVIRTPATATAPSVTYLLDGVQTYRNTNAAEIRSDTMSVHMQASTDGTAPAAGTTGTVEIAWITAYQYTGGAQHRLQRLRGASSAGTAAAAGKAASSAPVPQTAASSGAAHRLQRLRGVAATPVAQLDPAHRIQRLRGAVSASITATVRHRIARLRAAVSAPVVVNPLSASLTGPAQVEAFETVTLDASQSTNATGWLFTQTAGPAVTLTGTGNRRTFVAPVITDGATLGFRVTVSAVGQGDKTADWSVQVMAPSEYLVLGNGTLAAIEQYLV